MLGPRPAFIRPKVVGLDHSGHLQLILASLRSTHKLPQGFIAYEYSVKHPMGVRIVCRMWFFGSISRPVILVQPRRSMLINVPESR